MTADGMDKAEVRSRRFQTIAHGQTLSMISERGGARENQTTALPLEASVRFFAQLPHTMTWTDYSNRRPINAVHGARLILCSMTASPGRWNAMEVPRQGALSISREQQEHF